MLPGGSGYFTCKQNIKLVTTKFKSGGLHEKHVVATRYLLCMFKTGVHLSHFPIIILSHFVSHTLHMCKSHPRLPLLPGCHILCEVTAKAEEAAEHQTQSATRHNWMTLGFIFPNNKYNIDERDRLSVRRY